MRALVHYLPHDGSNIVMGRAAFGELPLAVEDEIRRFGGGFVPASGPNFRRSRDDDMLLVTNTASESCFHRRRLGLTNRLRHSPAYKWFDRPMPVLR